MLRNKKDFADYQIRRIIIKFLCCIGWDDSIIIRSDGEAPVDFVNIIQSISGGTSIEHIPYLEEVKVSKGKKIVEEVNLLREYTPKVIKDSIMNEDKNSSLLAEYNYIPSITTTDISPPPVIPSSHALHIITNEELIAHISHAHHTPHIHAPSLSTNTSSSSSHFPTNTQSFNIISPRSGNVINYKQEIRCDNDNCICNTRDTVSTAIRNLKEYMKKHSNSTTNISMENFQKAKNYINTSLGTQYCNLILRLIIENY
jgi:aspartate carbamoyltransferase regulatory subunit